MVKDVELYALKDKERKNVIDAKNEADIVIYFIEKSLTEYKDKLLSETIESI